MPIAQTRLEQLQVLKLLQSVRAEDKTQIEKLATNGIPDLINYSGTAFVGMGKICYSLIH